MKKFTVIFILIISLFQFSVFSYAVAVIDGGMPSITVLPFVTKTDSSYIIDFPVNKSDFSSADLDFWNDFKDALSGKSSNIAVMIYSRFLEKMCFVVLEPKSYHFTYSGSTYSRTYIVPDSGKTIRSMSVNVSTGSIVQSVTNANILMHDPNNSKVSASGGTFVFFGGENLKNNPSSSTYSDRVVYYTYKDLPPKFSGDLSDLELDLFYILKIDYLYSDGTQAFETYTNAFSEGDSFSIPSPTLGGFKPSINTISGQMGNTDLLYTVTYTPINHSVTVNYQYENGSKALESYSGTFSEGQPYSIPTPAIKGYTPSLNIISGEMGTSDLSYTVIFTKAKEPDPPPSSSGNSSSENSGSSSSANGGYVVWNPSFMAKGFQNVSNMIGIAFNTFIWLFLGITGIFIIIKLVRYLFK